MWGSTSISGSLSLFPDLLWASVTEPFRVLSVGQIDQLEIDKCLPEILEITVCKLFELRIDTWSFNCLQMSIICYLKLHNCLQKTDLH